MAEDYGVSLKITADTSDLDKIPQKAEATRQEIEQPVAQTVKVDVEQPKPVKIEAKAEKIRIEVEDAEAKKRIAALTADEGVKRIRVVSEDGKLATRSGGKEIFEIEVDAEKAKQTIADLKADNRIRFSVETPAPVKVPVEKPKQVEIPVKPVKPVEIPVVKPDVPEVKPTVDLSGFTSLTNTLRGVRTAITGVMRAFGVFSMVAGIVYTAVESFRALKEWIDKSETAARKLRDSIVDTNFASQVAMEKKAYDDLNSSISKTLQLERERASISARRTEQARKIEDAELSLKEQKAIAAVNPGDKNYAEEVEKIRRDFEGKRADLRADRADEDGRAEATRLYGEADAQDKIATAIQKKIDAANIQYGKMADESSRLALSHPKTDDDKQARDTRLKQLNDLMDRAFDNIKAMSARRDEASASAASLRRQAGEQLGAGTAGRITADAERLRIENERIQKERERAARESELDKQDASQNEALERRRSRANESEEFEREVASLKDRAKNGTTDAERNEAENRLQERFRERETAALGRRDDAEQRLKEEMAKPVSERNRDEMAKARQEIEQSDAEARQMRKRGEDFAIGRANEKRQGIDSYFGDLAQRIVDSRPKDRLTAMGLSSGGSGDHTVREQADNVKLLVQLVKQQIAATKDINVNTTATYAP